MGEEGQVHGLIHGGGQFHGSMGPFHERTDRHVLLKTRHSFLMMFLLRPILSLICCCCSCGLRSLRGPWMRREFVSVHYLQKVRLSSHRRQSLGIGMEMRGGDEWWWGKMLRLNMGTCMADTNGRKMGTKQDEVMEEGGQVKWITKERKRFLSGLEKDPLRSSNTSILCRRVFSNIFFGLLSLFLLPIKMVWRGSQETPLLMLDPLLMVNQSEVQVLKTEKERKVEGTGTGRGALCREDRFGLAKKNDDNFWAQPILNRHCCGSRGGAGAHHASKQGPWWRLARILSRGVQWFFVASFCLLSYFLSSRIVMMIAPNSLELDLHPTRTKHGSPST